jgi:hypothetical protein
MKRAMGASWAADGGIQLILNTVQTVKHQVRQKYVRGNPSNTASSRAEFVHRSIPEAFWDWRIGLITKESE